MPGLLPLDSNCQNVSKEVNSPFWKTITLNWSKVHSIPLRQPNVCFKTFSVILLVTEKFLHFDIVKGGYLPPAISNYQAGNT